jgi:uncharacterized protein DUF4352
MGNKEMRILFLIILAAWGLIMFEAYKAPESEPVTTKTLTQTPDTPIGMSQDNPAPLGQSVVCADNFEITTLKTERGQQALNKITAYNADINKPNAGMEYILVTLSAKFVENTEQSKRFDTSLFTVVNDKGVLYGKPSLALDGGLGRNFTEELAAGDITEGEIDFLISQSEKNLVLIYTAAVVPQKPCYLSL